MPASIKVDKMPYNKNEASRRYRENHREERSISDKAWKKANPDKVLATRRRYYDTHKEKVVATSIAWYEKHKEERRRYHKERRETMRKIVLEALGGKCACCGETEPKFLSVDHINSNGAEHRKEIGRTSIYLWLIKHNFPSGFQVLCHNCNMAKGFYGSCPHLDKKEDK